MSIRTISTEQLRRMGDREGLILQGCGGDPQEWLDGINEILTNEGILKKGAGFEEAYSFRHDGLTCLLFPFKENMELDMGKLAVWRLASYSTFGGTWLSDYVPNRLGGLVQVQESKAEPEHVKPDWAGLLNVFMPTTTEPSLSATMKQSCWVWRATAGWTVVPSSRGLSLSLEKQVRTSAP